METPKISPEIVNKLQAVFALKGLDLFYSLALFVVGWILITYLSRYLKKKIQSNTKVDVTLGIVLTNVTRYILLGFIILAFLNAIGVHTTPILTVLGAAGLAIGLSLQGTLSNIAAGIVLIVLRPFKIGENIKTSDIEYGVVASINLFSTEVKTFDGKMIFIPNSKLLSGPVFNFTRNAKRRVEYFFSIDYSDDYEKVNKAIIAALKKKKYVLSKPEEPFCVLWDFLDSGIQLHVRVWIKSADYLKMRIELPEVVYQAVKETGASFPFPQQVVRLFDENEQDIETNVTPRKKDPKE